MDHGDDDLSDADMSEDEAENYLEQLYLEEEDRIASAEAKLDADWVL